MAKGDICQKCGSSESVRKVYMESFYWCFKCRQSLWSSISIDEARAIFNRRKESSEKSWVADFDTLLAEFSNDCSSFQDIADRLNISHSLVWRLWKEVFSKFVPRRTTGRERRRICTRKTRLTQIQEGFSGEPRFQRLFKKLQEEGLTAQPLAHHEPRVGYGAKHSTTRLLINRHVCSFKTADQPSRIKDTQVWRFQVTSLAGIDFFICQVNTVETPRFLVIPARAVRKKRTIYVPLAFKRSDYHKGNSPIKVDWLEFLEAWHLLRPFKAKPQSPSA